MTTSDMLRVISEFQRKDAKKRFLEYSHAHFTLIKEYAADEIKVSMRAKTYADVAQVAVEFDGGGHTKAAGFTGRGSMEEIKAIVKSRIEKQLSICH